MRTVRIMSGILAFAPAALAGPISFTENWDAYALGTGDASYNATWATQAGASRYPIATSANDAGTPQSAPNNLDQLAGEALGVVNVLSDGVEMGVGEYLAATAASPIVAGIYWHPITNNRQTTSFVLELLQGDTVVVGMANSMVLGGGNNNPHWWTGSSWHRDRGTVLTAFAWNHVWVEMVANPGGGFDVTYHAGAYSSDRYVDTTATGVDTIRVRSVDTTDGGPSWIDDVYITGGDIVPEPTALWFLTLGGLAILRRRC